MNCNIYPDKETLSKALADFIINDIEAVLKQQDRYTIALSGGSTPKQLYELLATGDYLQKIDCNRLHFFFGDERYVPLEDERNNARMAAEALLNKIPVPKTQVHIIDTVQSPQASAAAYEVLLRTYFPNEKTFDLVLLGIGDNAHTLSLFPGYPQVHEREKWVVSFYLEEQSKHRITLTAPVVNMASKIIFLAAGTDKAAAIDHITGDEIDVDLYPAQIIQPYFGQLYYFLDEHAAADLAE
jgi:6-phosphogluconolactonase